MTQATSEPLSLALPWRLAIAIAAGLLLAAGYALHPLWWASWLAPVPLILASSGSKGNARLAGAIAGALAFVTVLGYYADILGVMTAILAALRIASWVFAARMAEAANRRLPLALAMFALPLTVTALELLTLLVSVHGAAGSLAYSQMDMPALVQVASLGGVPAVVFLILLPGSFASAWLARPRPTAGRLAAAGLFTVLIAGIVVYSYARMMAPLPGTSVTATLIATNRFPGSPTDWPAVWSAYGPAVAHNASRGGIVVLPEKIALLEPAQAAMATHDLSLTAQATGATLVTGIEVHDGGPVYHNRAVVARPDGSLAWYDKQRMVPVFEDRDVPGKTPLLIQAAQTELGVAICKDMHIPSIGHQYAGQAAVMAVPAWDFGRDGWMGARMTQLRGIESGYAIIRSSRNGMVGAYDDNGRIIAEQVATDAMTVVTAQVPTAARHTVYAMIGDTFGYLCCLLLVALLAWMWRRPRLDDAQAG